MSDFISLSDAIAMTTNYRNQKDNILAPGYQGTDILPIAETFDRASIEALLAETDCAFIRVYLGMRADLQVRLVIVGADSQDIDILPPAGPAPAIAAGAQIVEDGIRCPPICSVSPLNP